MKDLDALSLRVGSMIVRKTSVLSAMGAPCSYDSSFRDGRYLMSGVAGVRKLLERYVPL
jgi:hypothetical protein